MIVVTAIAGKWFPYDRCNHRTFFLSDGSDHSDRSDHMETRLKVETVALGNIVLLSGIT